MKTVSLELAKQLKEAGYPQTTYLFYSKPYDIHDYAIFERIQENSKFPPIAAPTADEILDRLPGMITIKGEDYSLKISCGDFYYGYLIWYGTYEKQEKGLPFVQFHYESDKVLVNAVAKMWIYLKQKNLLTPQE